MLNFTDPYITNTAVLLIKPHANATIQKVLVIIFGLIKNLIAHWVCEITSYISNNVYFIAGVGVGVYTKQSKGNYLVFRNNHGGMDINERRLCLFI